jgi:hypothetical protein
MSSIADKISALETKMLEFAERMDGWLYIWFRGS